MLWGYVKTKLRQDILLKLYYTTIRQQLDVQLLLQMSQSKQMFEIEKGIKRLSFIEIKIRYMRINCIKFTLHDQFGS